MSILRASHDPKLSARIRTRHALHYGVRAPDYPGFVRAASSVTWLGERLAVVQDDTLLIALVDPVRCAVEAVALPLRADGARTFDVAQGNKKFKADFEGCVSALVGGAPTLFAFGSGSHENRESIAMLSRAGAQVESRIIHVPGLYAALRSLPGFLSSELNLEGALLLGDTLRLFQRSNGAPLAPDAPLSCATCDLSWPELLAHLAAPETARVPTLREVRTYDLGMIDGARLTFTDAALMPDGAVAFSASAEASPNAYDDGVVTGSALGKISAHGVSLCLLTDEQGAPVREKVEGLVFAKDTTERAYVVFDPDDHLTPATMALVDLHGF